MGRLSSPQHPYLRQRYRTWYVRLAVPTDVRDSIGTTVREKSLQTRAMEIAIQRARPILEKWEAEFEAHRHQLGLTEAELRRKIREGEVRAYDYLQDNPRHGPDNLRLMGNAAALFPQSDEDRARGDGVENAIARFEKGLPAPPPVREQASETPVEAYVEKWLDANRKGRKRASPLKPKTRQERRRAVEKFAGWLRGKSEDISVEAVSRRDANEFIEEVFESAGTHPITANKQIRSLSLYWQFLILQEVVDTNPWDGQSLEEPAIPEAERKRPFTDGEIRMLFAGDPGQPLADVMRIAALTGMRINEICELKVGDCGNSLFKITDSKTDAGLRQVPIHSGLEKLVTARTAGKDDNAYLIHELKTPADGSSEKRSNPLVKKFTTYRRTIGVDDVRDGGRVSRVTFHSFRNWFARKAEEALEQGETGFTYDTIQDVLGHSRTNRTAGISKGYAGPSGRDAKKACVEAVRLPGSD